MQYTISARGKKAAQPIQKFIKDNYSATGKAFLKILPDVIGLVKVIYEAFKGTHDSTPPNA